MSVRPASVNSTQVLLVEDNPGDARLVRESLKEGGSVQFELTHVGCLQEAIDLIGIRQFDIVLLDLSLPDARGLYTLNKLQLADRSLPIVVLSGHDDEQLATEAVQQGAQDYLVKGQSDGNLIGRAMRYAIERKRSEEHLAYLAHYDPLTDLANRYLFRLQLAQSLERAQRHQFRVAVLFLDLDHFKHVNDTLGHDVGDELLRAAAQRLKQCIRKEDFVSRLGGDEFTVILEYLFRQEDAAIIAQKIIGVISQPFSLLGQEVTITVSIGIAVYPDCGNNPETLTKNADAALYYVKGKGRSGYAYYNQEMNAQSAERLILQNALRHALENEELHLYYQPQVDLKTGSVFAVEALLRWLHPQHGMVPPAKFINLAEETGLIIPIGEWVLETACRQTKNWQEFLPTLKVAVNLSPRQFTQIRLVDKIGKILELTGLDARYLELEITESMLMQDVEEAIAHLKALKNLGVQISIDDFGTGYSSLSYLKRFPLDGLKIDQSFVRDIAIDPDDAAIVLAVIRMAHSLGLQIVAEGVETQEQSAFLSLNQCDRMQGYYFSYPISVADMTALLQENRCLNPMQSNDTGRALVVVLVTNHELQASGLLGGKLDAMGCQVLKASSLGDALELIRLHSVRIVFVDQMVAGQPGLRLVKKLKQSHPHIVSVLISDKREAKELVDAINEGILNRLLVDPVGHDDLLQILQEAFLLQYLQPKRAGVAGPRGMV